ncbi:MAG: HAMP domain-containing sensor histidine kinase [Sedimentisphaerales bacterium]|jgi:signal transduction histidine kinase
MLTTANSFLSLRLRGMIKLRWFTAILVVLATYVAHDFLGVTIREGALYVLAVLLLAYNFLVLLLLKRYSGRSIVNTILMRSIDFQILPDILFLTFVLHYSGGIESPFVFLFLFNVMIVGFFLPVWKSYLVTTLAALLFGLMILFEYLDIIPHFCPKASLEYCSYRDADHVLGFAFVFTATLFLGILTTTSISAKGKRPDTSDGPDNAKQGEQDHIMDKCFVGLAHDVKGHIAAIQSCLAVVLKGAIDAQSLEFANRAYDRTQRFASHMRIFIKLASMRFNSATHIEAFHIGRMVDDVVNTLKAKAQERPITLDCHFSCTEHNICGDKSSIQGMITSVLQNMMMLTRDNGTISVCVTNHAGLVQLRISDTGISLPTTNLSSLSAGSRWVGGTEETKRKDTALELLKIKHIVEDHGGEIELNGQDEHEANFVITLPCFSEIDTT